MHAPNCTPVPNVFLDNLSALKESEIRVYLTIARAVLGYPHKKASTAHLMKATGLARKTVLEAAASLRERGLAVSWKEGNTLLHGLAFDGEEPPKSVPKRRKTAKTPPPPAVAVFRDVMAFYPRKTLWDMIASEVGEREEDLAFWREVVMVWAALGWNPRNVGGMLEFYRRRVLPPGNNGFRKAVLEEQDIVINAPKINPDELF